MKLERLNTGHYAINRVPVYELVRKRRLKLGLSQAAFAKQHRIDRAAQYRFELGNNRSYPMAVRQLEALGYKVSTYVF